MAFQPGNKHGANRGDFMGAVRRAIAQGNGEQLRAAAEALLNKAAAGEPWAIQMLADRLDGKPHQSMTVETKRDVDSLSLAELRDRVAEMLGGVGQANDSAGQSGELH